MLRFLRKIVVAYWCSHLKQLSIWHQSCRILRSQVVQNIRPLNLTCLINNDRDSIFLSGHTIYRILYLASMSCIDTKYRSIALFCIDTGKYRFVSRICISSMRRIHTDGSVTTIIVPWQLTANHRCNTKPHYLRISVQAAFMRWRREITYFHHWGVSWPLNKHCS